MDSLLSTKIVIPPVRARLVERPRLTAQLDLGRRRRLTLISAPAGFGKTTLLSGWAARSDVPVAWLSLDEGDQDPVRFLTYLIAALERCVGDLSVEMPATLQSPLPTLERVMTTLINAIGQLGQDLFLVLDDYHLAAAPETDALMIFLLDHLPANLHIYIATRADPALPLARLRGRGQLVEVRAADLRFLDDEALAFLAEVMDVDLSSAAATRLAQRTEGWVVGLQMAALSMRGRDDPADFIAAFAGSHRYVMDYLVSEVLDRQTPEVQAFLLKTSILGEMTASLCDAVRDTEGGSDSLLAALERSNLFIVSLDDRREWFRYHRLFADLLRQRLGQWQPELVPELHHRAAEWYEAHMMPAEAIEHMLTSGDMGSAADLIVEAAETVLARGELATFRRWIEALPDDEIRQRPTLCICQAWSLFWSGRGLSEIDQWLNRLGELSEKEQGQVASLRALLALYRTDMEEAAAQARLALAHLGPDDVLFRGMAAASQIFVRLDEGATIRDRDMVADVVQETADAGNVLATVISLSFLGELRMRQGLLDEAREVYRQALDYAKDAEGKPLPAAGQALIGIGTVALLRNELDKAEAYLTKGTELAQSAGTIVALDGLAYLSRVQQARGDVAEAEAGLSEALRLARQFDATVIDDWVIEMERARFWLLQGNLAAAERWFEGLELSESRERSGVQIPADRVERLRKYHLVILGRLRLAQGRAEEALAALDEAQPRLEARGRVTALIELLLLKAQAYDRLGDRGLAAKTLDRALSLAARGGNLRTFVDAGEGLVPLLQRAARIAESDGFVHRVLEAVGAKPSTPSGQPAAPGVRPPILAEPLTERELEVLALLPSHLTSTEIADELYVAASTVRTHIKHIYGKLDVHSRDEAVARARELGLL